MKSLRIVPILMLASALLLAQTPVPKVSSDLNGIVAAGASSTGSSGMLPAGSSALASSDGQSITSSAGLSASVNVIVQFNTAPSAADLAALASFGQVKQVLTGINAALVVVPTSKIASIAASPNVKFITPDRTLKGKLDLTAAAVNAATAAYYRLDGTGVGIAIIDSGVTVRADLKNSGGSPRVVHSEDFTGLGTTDDGYGHGTHVAGIAAGNGTSSKKSTAMRTLQGIAPNANIVNLRVLDSSGQGNDSSVIAAIDRAIALKSQYNIRVINLSLGRGVFESYALDPLCQAVEAAWRAGIVVVAAAGNKGRNNNGGINGYGTIEAPGNDPYVITVGAMKTMGTPQPQRRPDGQLQFERADPLRPYREARSGGSRQSSSRPSLTSTTATLFTQYPSSQVPMSYYISGCQWDLD